MRLEVAELRASRMRLALAADAERRSIERALHESVQQLLVTLAANLELAAVSVDVDPAAAKTLLPEMRRDVQQALDETRKLADRIYPPLLDAGGLGVALRSAAASVDVPIRIDVAVGAECLPEIAGMVYFCCLDLLERVDGGSPVAITVRDEEEALTFEILAGCDVDAGSPVRDRVEALGGRLTVRQGPDHQTRVSGSLPLPR